ncbi:sphingolipid delta(4)-desaturase DES1-like [Leguminivora glycinivorella]|uniref:sphingolipid delta(4)-desaturase DES1-like n=1 Tax=Leguminivora glycinivorella TaxID=1035111 RepID=UPI00200D3178|nr:sphingolipid delta(4)-desaturase DES1-like [Leguminivora glycinivorella]XP_047991662.1 sphingolipid delta(4)-desaturase DES1-like [Leguminivora glycinivorella]
MGAKVSRTDFEWVYTEEPHSSRRKMILEKYPEIKQLFGHDPNFKWVVMGLVVVQLVALPFIHQLSWPLLLVTAYCFGGFVNHALMVALHEIAHNFAFGHARPLANRLFGMVANLPLGLPASITFKKYHMEHHKYQGVDDMDPDLPTVWEARLFTGTLGKLAWLALLPVLYTVRPLLVRPMALERLELLNIVVQMAFNACVVQLFGWKAVWYLILGTLLSMGWHPLAGHFISEHYMFKKGVETYSYYGVANYITFNLGYHMEHHDFPAIPGSRLPELKRIASEFYDELPHHRSYLVAMYQFVTDPALGPAARVIRRQQPHHN